MKRDYLEPDASVMLERLTATDLSQVTSGDVQCVYLSSIAASLKRIADNLTPSPSRAHAQGEH